MPTVNKKERLLRLALKIFAEKGFGKTTISEIANAAGIREAGIYQYFKSKEDLLFNIPVSITEFIVDDLTAHLDGLAGAANKVRQLILFYLDFMEKNPAYATIILFDLRGNRRFYDSPAYTSFRRFNQVVMRILNEGVKSGAFRQDVRPSLIKNMIFGTMDHIILSWLVFNRPQRLIQLAGELGDLILNAIQPDKPQAPVGAVRDGDAQWGINKRQAILKAAESHFARKGYAKTKIADIARSLNIGEATIYESFKSKQDILFNIPTLMSEPLIDYTAGYLQRNFQAEILLRRFVQHYLSYLQSNRNYLTILIFELKSNRQFYHSSSYQSFKRYNDELIKILQKGRADNLFSDQISIYLCRHLIFGSVDHMALTWLLFDSAPSLLDQVDELIKLLMQAVGRF
ncbi:hypothetical protein DSCO28_47430 [Desulfosarcina ovata subsp. sediminis]|uniref:HTH tetR-type domain-containing protein n=1 Tax=Desulfosarcina ovata subsp. sediminis TaxID=885957 RepID=A0A5K7ZVB4_9BACT|nr:TetR/AcrR family transcriptional regulator [Desulfosarcina ovata]BBO84177.1 hypothetical protein DSCO28_47430 [Desulfosarcina ovata subsp. sediminis]